MTTTKPGECPDCLAHWHLIWNCTDEATVRAARCNEHVPSAR